MAFSNLDTNTVLAKAFGFLNSVTALTVFVLGTIAIFTFGSAEVDGFINEIGAALALVILAALVSFLFGFTATVISIGNELRDIKSLLEEMLKEQSELTKVFKDGERATSADESFSALE